MEEEVKKNNKKSIIIILIIFLIICLIVGILYLYNNRNNNKNIENNNTNNNVVIDSNEEKEDTTKLNTEEINNYINDVPFMGLSGASYCINADTCLDMNHNGGDAYSGVEVNKENIDKKLLVVLGYDKVSSRIEETVSVDKIKSYIKDKYDITITDDDLPYSIFVNGVAYELKDNNYVSVGVAGNNPGEKLSKVLNYYLDNEDLVIEEEALFVNDEMSIRETNEYKIFSSTFDYYNNSKELERIKLNCKIEDDNCEIYSDLNIDDIKSSYTMFKHTFKNVNGKYIWYSTEYTVNPAKVDIDEVNKNVFALNAKSIFKVVEQQFIIDAMAGKMNYCYSTKDEKYDFGLDTSLEYSAKLNERGEITYLIIKDKNTLLEGKYGKIDSTDAIKIEEGIIKKGNDLELFSCK